jgi:xanthine dehydrogenase YagS FAD-binding subunit
MGMDRFAYARATTLEDALEALTEGCRPLAGGTDLVAMMKEELVSPERLVDLKRIPDLDQVRAEDDGLHIGALIKLSALAADPALRDQPGVACLYEALLATASPQLRHMATLGGNLLQRPRCWYFRNKLTCYIVHPSDPAVALLAVDASVVVAVGGRTHTIPIDEFYLLPSQDPHREVELAQDELVTEVVIPRPGEGSRGIYVKVGERQAWDFGLLSAAVQLRFDGDTVRQARIVLGAVAPVPWRARDAEDVLVGSALTAEVIERTAEASTVGARPLAQNAYKVELAQGVVRQALSQLQTNQA